MAKQKVTVQDAAEALGVSVDAVRQRIRRGKLARALPPDEDDKRVYVWLDSDATGNGDASSQGAHEADRDELLATYRDQVAFLRRELERKDAILLTLAQRVPELVALASPGPPGAPQTAAEGSEGPGPRPATEGTQEGSQRSWWRRWFGFE